MLLFHKQFQNDVFRQVCIYRCIKTLSVTMDNKVRQVQALEQARADVEEKRAQLIARLQDLGKSAAVLEKRMELEARLEELNQK